MDIFAFLGLSRVSNLMGNRATQLQRQVQQNQEIEKHQDQCPKDIIKFFIYSAQINTILSNKIYQTSIFNILDNIKQNLDNNNQEQNTLQDIIDSNKFCDKLNDYTKKQKKFIDSN